MVYYINLRLWITSKLKIASFIFVLSSTIDLTVIRQLATPHDLRYKRGMYVFRRLPGISTKHQVLLAMSH